MTDNPAKAANDAIQKIVDNVMGKNFSPSTPEKEYELLNTKVLVYQSTLDRYNDWLAECWAKALRKQQDTWAESNKSVPQYVQDCWDEGFPYLGAIGGGLTYEITPTSIGQITKVRFDFVDEVIDISEYDTW